MYKVITKISATINFEKYVLEERYFVIDDTVIPKRGRNIENVSFIHDHNIGRSVLVSIYWNRIMFAHDLCHSQIECFKKFFQFLKLDFGHF